MAVKASPETIRDMKKQISSTINDLLDVVITEQPMFMQTRLLSISMQLLFL